MNIDGITFKEDEEKDGFLYNDFYEGDFPLVDDAVFDYEEEWFDDPGATKEGIIIHDGKNHQDHHDHQHKQPEFVINDAKDIGDFIRDHGHVVHGHSDHEHNDQVHHNPMPTIHPHGQPGQDHHNPGDVKKGIDKLCYLPPCNTYNNKDLNTIHGIPVIGDFINHHPHGGHGHTDHVPIDHGHPTIHPIGHSDHGHPTIHSFKHFDHGHPTIHPHGHSDHGHHTIHPHGQLGHSDHHPIQPNQHFIPPPPDFHQIHQQHVNHHPTPKIKTVYPNLIPRPRPSFLPPPEIHPLFSKISTTPKPHFSTAFPHFPTTTTTNTILTSYAPLLPTDSLPKITTPIPYLLTNTPSTTTGPPLPSSSPLPHLPPIIHDSPQPISPLPHLPPIIYNNPHSETLQKDYFSPSPNSLDLGALPPALPSALPTALPPALPPGLPTNTIAHDHFDVAHHGSIGLQTTVPPLHTSPAIPGIHPNTYEYSTTTGDCPMI